MPELLEFHLPELRQELQSGRPVFVFSDFDGTLVPIRPRPEDCYLPTDVRSTFQRLARIPGVQTAIVSGRELNDLRGRIGLPDMVLAGNHGLEIRGPDFSFIEPQAIILTEVIRQIHLQLSEQLRKISGAWVEDKGLSLSIHFRQVAAEQMAEVEQLVENLTEDARKQQQVVLRPGKMVVEVRPAVHWHKGFAVQWLVHHFTTEHDRPLCIYLGDDETDEDAFRNLEGHITVAVGHRVRTLARYLVEAPTDIYGFLDWIAVILESSPIPPGTHLPDEPSIDAA